MTKRDWAVLACRILGLYLLAAAVLSVEYVIAFAVSLTGPWSGHVGDTLRERFLGIIPAVLPILYGIVGLLVWKKSPHLARLMVADLERADEPAASSGAWNLDGLTEVAVAMTGLFLLVTSLRWAVSIGYSLGYRAEVGSGVIARHGVPIESLANLILRVAVGLWLMLGSRRIARFIRAARSGGAPAGGSPGAVAGPDGSAVSPSTGPTVASVVAAIVLAVLLVIAAVAIISWLAGSMVRVPF